MPFSSFAADMILPIRNVVDGDTISSYVKLPCPLCAVYIRILGIDTPESNYLAKCPKEKTLGIAAKNHVKDIAFGQTEMIAKNVKWDKYGGRINAVVIINGIDVGQSLIDNGLAKPYSGTGSRPSWCD